MKNGYHNSNLKIKMLKFPIVTKDAVRVLINLQKLLHLNTFIFFIWVPVIAFFLYIKFNDLSHLSRFLSLAVFTVSVVIESTRLYFGIYGTLSCRIPELAGFFMISILMQIPLISFLLFNPYLQNTPTEVTLHTIIWSITFIESILSYRGIKHASDIAKSIYFTHSNLS